MGIGNIQDRMVAVISRNQSDLTYTCTQFYVVRVVPKCLNFATYYKGYTKYPYCMVLSSVILLTELYIIGFLGIHLPK